MKSDKQKAQHDKTQALRNVHGLFTDAVRVMREVNAAGLTHEDLVEVWNNVIAANGLPAQLVLPEGMWGFKEGMLLGKALRAAQEEK